MESSKSKLQPSTRLFAIGTQLASLAILPIQSKYSTPPFQIIATQKKAKSRVKDQKSKYQRQYIQRSITLKANEKKSYSSLVNPLPEKGVIRKDTDKCMAILKIDENGKVTFNFCNQKQDFKFNINLVESRMDIYKMQQESQLKLMDGRRKNDALFNFGGGEEGGEGGEQEGEKEKEKPGKKGKKLNSDEEDDPYSGNDSD